MVQFAIPGMAEHLMGTVVDGGEDCRPQAAGNQVEVTGVKHHTHINDIRAFFHDTGDILNISEHGDSVQRFIQITFSDHEGAANALMMDGEAMDGQELGVSAIERKTSLLQGRTMAMCSSVLNLLNAIVGAGTLGLAYIMRGSGVILFLILLFLMVIVIDYSLQLLLAAAYTTRTKGEMLSYERLGALAWGERGRILVSAMILIQNTGAMVTYFKVFKDVMPSIMELVVSNPDSLMRNGDFLTSIAASVVFLPACSSKIGYLAYVGFVAIFLTVFFVTFVTVKSQTLSEEETCSNLSGSGSGSDSIMSFAGETADYADCSLKMFAPSVQTFLALPTISFSFVCHTSVLPVFHELQEADEMGRSRRSHKRIMKAVHVSLLIALVLYSVGAFFGYYTFREKTNQDLLKNYSDVTSDKNNPLSIAVRLAFMGAVVSSIPLLIFPYRRSLDNLAEAYQRLNNVEVTPEREGFAFWWRHVVRTGVIIGVMLTGALFVPHITTVFSAVGATSSVALVFLLPSALYIKLCLSDENLALIKKKGSVLLRETGRLTKGALLTTQAEDMEYGTADDHEYDSTPPPLAVTGPKAVFILGVVIFFVSWAGLIYLWVHG